ncbi:MAG: LpqB family beta-propeller domain-containing protein [Actinomycetota bacterium]|nr:LpqB family beta-propeller domain-containing protein [Actinomycetota bacterium]
MKALRIATALTAVGLLLSACGVLPWSVTAQVPEGGSIQQGDASAANREDQFIRVIPQSPRKGMTPAEIVQGFLDASAAFENDHEVARQFLTQLSGNAWDPNAGVRVFKGAPDLVSNGPVVRFAAPLAGEISRRGTYQLANANATLNAEFTLEKQSDEWRIAKLPQGLELSTVDVARAFRPLSVYYFNPQYSTLVPDVRMIPVPGNGVATGLIQALLDGPDPWLAPAVKTAFPLGVGLNFDFVGVNSGVAKVDLTADALFASDSVRLVMAQQIVGTLRQLSDVSAVSITSGGQLLTIPGVPYPIPRDEWPSIDPSGLDPGAEAVFANAGGVSKLAKGQAQQIVGYPTSANSAFTQVVVNRSGGLLSGVDALGRVWSALIETNTTWSKLPITRAIQWLEFDANGGLWVWDPFNGLAVWDAPGPIKDISVTGMPYGATLVKAVPSRDGARAALIIRKSGTTSVYLARIERNVETNVRVISGLRPFSPTATGVLDLDWSSANSLAFIGRIGNGDVQAFDLDLASGALAPQGGPENPESIAAAPGLPVLIAAKNGLIYQLDAGTWTVRTPGWSPAYPS